MLALQSLGGEQPQDVCSLKPSFGRLTIQLDAQTDINAAMAPRLIAVSLSLRTLNANGSVVGICICGT